MEEGKLIRCFKGPDITLGDVDQLFQGFRDSQPCKYDQHLKSTHSYTAMNEQNSQFITYKYFRIKK
jgi:hypothetical protein